MKRQNNFEGFDNVWGRHCDGHHPAIDQLGGIHVDGGDDDDSFPREIGDQETLNLGECRGGRDEGLMRHEGDGFGSGMELDELIRLLRGSKKENKELRISGNLKPTSKLGEFSWFELEFLQRKVSALNE